MSRAQAAHEAQPAGGGMQAPHGWHSSAEAEQSILRAALEVLGEVGYSSFSIEAVAARAGVGRPTIYRRWASKLELAIEAVARLAPPLKIADSGDPVADFRRLFTALIPDPTNSAAERVN